MMDDYKLQKLRDLPIGEGLLQRLGITLSRGRFLCPAHTDHTPSASISKKNGRWKCWSCGAGGNAIDLTMTVLHKNFREAVEWLANEENVILTEYKLSVPEPVRKVTFDPKRYERYFEHPWLNEAARRFLFDERRLDPRVVSWCSITSWTDRDGVNWLQIPYYGVDGQLIGVQNRNLDGGQPRFRFPYGCQPAVYGLPMLRHLKPEDEVWIAEGPSDAWSHMSDHHKVLAIASATLLQPKDRQLLQEITSRLSIRWKMSPDNDSAGLNLLEQLKKTLPNLEHVPLPEGVKDYSDYYVKQKNEVK